MEEVTGLLPERRIEEELDLLKCLIDLKVPVDILFDEFERSLNVMGADAAESTGGRT
jgi:hypothetical protein